MVRKVGAPVRHQDSATVTGPPRCSAPKSAGSPIVAGRAPAVAREQAIEDVTNGYDLAHPVDRRPHPTTSLSQQELEQIADDYKRTAGFDVDCLNGRPSLSVRSPSA